MAEGEYESQKALAAIIPDNVVIPMAWGIFEEDKSKAFFMTRFRDLRDRPPPTAMSRHFEEASPDVRIADW